jgi:DNA replication protein DnaC
MTFQYRGKAIIDPVSTAKFGDMKHVAPWYPLPEKISDRSAHRLDFGENANMYAQFDDQPLDAQLTEAHHLLMCPFIGGYALDDKSWRYFDVSAVKSARHDSGALSNLQLEKTKLNIIKAITQQQITTQLDLAVDFIEGKGEGQVILLHGPPGVGKTYTVEAIAESFGRPLLCLTVADIGIVETDMERQLTRWFTLAETWNAVLLIDEADVFLEKRSKDSLQRNSLVSVFLRKLEYFRGLLFLTTNRTGQIDDSFSSRIHAKIQYPKLDNEKRLNIWKTFFEKLDARSIKPDGTKRWYVAKTAREYVLSSPEILASEWNGREIRNTFQTALALATFEASEDDGRPAGMPVEIKVEHFRDIMQMSKNFKEYVANTAGGKNEDQRAESKQERKDT